MLIVYVSSKISMAGRRTFRSDRQRRRGEEKSIFSLLRGGEKYLLSFARSRCFVVLLVVDGKRTVRTSTFYQKSSPTTW